MKKCIFTFDDGLETHLALAAPVLKEYNFCATFFVTAARKLWHRFEPEVKEDELEWDRVADLYHMGFEIGNHTWSHSSGAGIKDVVKLESFLVSEYDIHTRSFCYPAYQYKSELASALRDRGYQCARMGYSAGDAMDSLNRKKIDYHTKDDDPFMIYCTGLFGKEADYNFDQFREDLANTPEESNPVFAFHGLRGLGRERYFEKCVEYLNDEGWQIAALRDLNER